MNDPKLKQQIADKIKGSSNILVTVSNDPSVDELSAALGLTLLLNKMDKHATAVVSGKIPPAITFLDPEKTFEDTTDSLRDFIIALDKEKADHLRYKLEGDLVKIYITPYRRTITDADLEFSQGDYNVELVIALGVENRDHLDIALDGHGKILHDATVITLTAGEQISNLGSIDWHDSNASSVSEMLTSLHESMKLDKKLMDKSIATAWLTGIVAATERFSNPRTTSRVMTLAANLMGAGADQQLIAAQLESAVDVADDSDETSTDMDQAPSETRLTEGEKTKLVKEEDQSVEAVPPRPAGELVISHEKQGTIEEVAEEVGAERLEESARAAERALEKHEELIAQATPTIDAPQAEDTTPAPRGAVSYAPMSPVSEAGDSAPSQQRLAEPTLGGTLNATSEQAAEDKRREIERDKNKVILSHNYIGSQQPTFDTAINSAVSDETANPMGSSQDTPLEPPSAPTATGLAITPPSEAPPVSAAAQVVPHELPPIPQQQPVVAAAVPTLADIDAENRAPVPHDEARAAVEAALAASPAPASMAQPVVPAPEDPVVSADFGLPLPPPPPLPADFSHGMPPMPADTSQPEILGDILAPAPEVQQVPGVVLDQQFAQSQPADPGQFRIPGQ